MAKPHAPVLSLLMTVACATLACAALTSAAAAGTTTPDRVQLKDGSVLFGTVVDADDGKVIMKTAFAEAVKIPQAMIESLRTETPMRLQFADGRVLESSPIVVRDEQLFLGRGEEEASYSFADLVRVNPEPWELGEGYRWTGLASAGLSLAQGNTENSELDYKAESTWTGLHDRFSLSLIGEYDEVNGRKNAQNWIARGKYDQFLNGSPWYTGANLSFEQDEFADTELRSYVGPYLGRKVFTDPLLTLEAEGGIAYVWEEFFVAEDNDYPAATWTLTASSDYLGDNTRLYFNQTGLWGFTDEGDVLLNSTAGLSFPLILNIEGSAEVIWKYDLGAVENVEKLDQTYRFRLGYRW
jgi:putative salt-induced outer membrane protein YdiY